MSKLIGEPVKVHGKEDSAIEALIWRKRLYRVNEVIGWWREPDAWWNGKAARFFVRVTATNSRNSFKAFQASAACCRDKVIVLTNGNQNV